ncbi:MAG TPA: PAS domain-containing sensor histidine kinase, partial [Pseudorhizobium sp.]|nr:PAS domain-containing sensor histidine kinase [Pseudorhizobium sp.]
MPMIQYPFIDIAAQEKVREPYSRGEAVVVFSPDMADILWANGRGARLFGFRSVYDFLDHPPSAQDLLLRQLGAAARNLTQLGDTVRVTIRATSAFRRVAVTGTCAVIDIHGEPAVLFNAPVEPTAASQNDRARSMIEGLDGADTHLAVMDAEGTVVASSTSFEQLSLTPQTARMLVNMSGAEANGLVKRPVPTQKGYLPAALAKVSVDPALHLLFVVEAPAPGVDLPPVEAAVERSAAAPKSEAPNDALVPTGFEEVVEAAARLEDIPELVEAAEVEPHPAAMQSPSDAMAGEAERTIFTNEPVEEQADAEHVHSLDDVHQPTLAPEEPEASSSAQFEFRPDTRATRFVWKIDADSRFCEISEEFAQTVGPHAADVKGMAFNEVAELFHLDPDGKITDLLRKRDTWSGKTIWWPVEGTALAVPIDLAALPTYTRTRAFDGFRGFGIIRATDAVEDPHAVGLSLGKTAKAENRSQETPEEGLECASTGAAGDEGNASIRPEPLHEEATGAVEREIINEGSPSEADMDEAAEDGADQGMPMEG